MKKRKGMSMLLVLTIVLLLSSCAARSGIPGRECGQFRRSYG
jgi:hypothetical protein